MYKLEAIFGETTETVTLSGLYQWDYGQKLYIKGLNLPPSLEIHFSNRRFSEALVMVATTQDGYTVVDVPNKLLEESKDIIAYIFYTHATEGKTLKKVVLKVEERAKPQDFVSDNPDATTILGDVVNKVNQNIQDNTQFKNDIEKDQADFKVEVNKLVAGKLIDDNVISDVRTWSSEKITNYPFTNVQGEDTVSFDSSVDQIVQPKLYGKSSQDGVPTPTEPVDIISKVVDKIEVGGGNLFNVNGKSDEKDGNLNYKVIDGGIEIENAPQYSAIRFIVNVPKNTNITLSANCLKDSMVELSSYKFTQGENKVITQVNRNEKTNTLNSSIYDKLYMSFYNINTGVFKTTKVMLNIGSKSLPFEPYKQPQTITLSKPLTLRGIQTKDGNVTIDGKQYISDVITEKDGVIGVERNVKELVLNGSENYTYSTRDTHNSFGLSVSELNKPDCKALCNKMSFCARESSLGTNDYGVLIGNYINIFVPKTNQEVTNIDTFKQWLVKNPLTVCFEPYESSFEPLPQVDQDKFKTLLAHKGINNLFANAYIDLNYISSKNYALPYPIYSESEVDEKLKDRADKTHTHTKSQITDMPTKLSQFANDSNYQNLNQVKALISALVNSAPSTLDTLNELAKALGNDPNFATTMTNLIATKAPLHHDHDDRYPTPSDIGNMRFKAISKSEYDSLGSKDPITMYFIYD